MKDLTTMTAPEAWNYFVELRGYREPDGDLEDDNFFDDEKIAKKYGDWDEENEWRKYDITNEELRSMLDEDDTKAYIEYMEIEIKYLDMK